MAEKFVYLALVHESHDGYGQMGTEILGVYLTKKSAQKALDTHPDKEFWDKYPNHHPYQVVRHEVK